MSRVRRIYVEKKDKFAPEAHRLAHELRHYLGIDKVENVRKLIRYDIDGVSEEVYEMAKRTVFSEPPVDDIFEDDIDVSGRRFTVELLPGQYDQRADSAQQCLQLLNDDAQPLIRSATTYIIEGSITDEEFDRICGYCINPVDSRMAEEAIPDTLVQEYSIPEGIEVMSDFCVMPESDFKELYESLSLAMTYADFWHIRNYFSKEEHRDPTITEIRVLDTYWSDHCRHTTFSTEIKSIEFEDGYYTGLIEETYRQFCKDFKEFYKDRDDKYICLMEMAILAARKLKSMGMLEDQEDTDEINACSIVVPIEVDGKNEEWLLNFKNETHNHPTEIEPFGGAATCLGGAIRDPLSGRTYVYQAMRITGAADPTRFAVEKPMEGKLPQMKIVREAAHGYSSYGNQIGLATGYVHEIYHKDYVAKRMEIGAVVGAAPRRAVRRLTSDPGDIIILLGGRTGRDGIGGATGSSKAHDTSSTVECGAEVQKGNPPTERKLQRLFRREEVSVLIKKCNDFGAGGVSVAIGELADGLDIDLDKVPKKYMGLDGTELAISESQERMAVVIDPKDTEAFLKYARQENLEATQVAVVTDEPRLVLKWHGEKIVDLSREFLNTNGAHQETDVYVESPSPKDNYFMHNPIPKVCSDIADNRIRDAFLHVLSDLNVADQKGLVEMFDSSIGAGSVLVPYGGRHQATPVQSMAAKFPVENGSSDAVSMMAYGFDPYLSSWSPYHGAIYAVTESIARIVASGGDHRKIRFSFQEYFRRMSEDPARWSQPVAALLGAYAAQMGFGLPSIGGKDSMSGSFNDIDVPPTLVSFAVDTASDNDIITPELKQAGNLLLLLSVKRDEYDVIDYDSASSLYDLVHKLMQRSLIQSAYAVDGYGVFAAAAKMAFGNGFGIAFDDAAISVDELFAPQTGSLILEIKKEHQSEVSEYIDLQGLSDLAKYIAIVTDEAEFRFKDVVCSLEDAITAWEEPLEGVFHTKTKVDRSVEGSNLWNQMNQPFNAKEIYINKHKTARPQVFIPVFFGTNCEYDSKKVFDTAGADTKTVVFCNQNKSDISDSVEEFCRVIDNSQIVFFPGGFSAGDEPEGSAKFFSTVFRNEKIKESFMRLLNERDGLVLGICNGFQALIKLGLVPYGRICPQEENSPTLTYNTIGRHVAKVAYTKVVSNLSPWLSKAGLDEVYSIPASHGEGRFVADDATIKRLYENGQIATRYVDENGTCTMAEPWNINGSYYAIEGITSPDGRVFGKMCHSERIGKNVMKNIYGNKDMKLFESGVEYFH